jgi:DNA-binding IclR family transcriptional regulator
MRTLERMIAVLEAVAECKPSSTPTMVAARTGLALSTAARLMRELSDCGLLVRSEAGAAYSLGPRLLDLSRLVQPLDLIEAALPEMQRIRDLSNETVSLHVRRGDLHVCVAQSPSPLPIGRIVRVGFTMPLHVGATGELLLADLSASELEDYLASAEIDRATRATFPKRLKTARENGWSVAMEALPGLSALAAAVRDNGEVIASLVISGPSSRLTRPRIKHLTPELLEAAGRISTAVKFGLR